ncbi:MAG: DUF6057 family protein [Bacteroidales bacterium]|nr:DUF6057 family protein [Bacteroidales bacterium]
MNSVFQKYGLTGILFAASFVFWGFFHPELLFYHEYYQMFLTTSDYFFERLAFVGGLADYLGEFVTQFFFYPVLGAAFVALLYAGFQIVTKQSFRIFGVDKNFYPLTFLPVVSVWFFMGSENLLLNFFMAVFLAVLIFVLTDRIKLSVIKPVIVIILYYLIGPAALITALMYALRVFKENKVLALLTVFVLPVEAWLFSRSAEFPTKSYFVGIDYIRFPFRSYWHLMMLLICPLLPYLLSLYKKEFSKKKCYIAALSVTAFAAVLIPQSTSPVAVQTIKMYSLIYNQKWDEAVEYYNKVRTANSYSVQCLNLALAQKGLLTENMFHYYQPGILALVSDFQTDMFTSLISGEVFFRLGAFNVAQRYAFECQENIANFRHSSKLFYRLAETAVMNDEFTVAKKYLLPLSKTMFYKDKAREYIELLYSGGSKNNIPEFAAGNLIKLEQDGAQEELNATVIFKNLLVKNPHNLLALQYYSAFSLLTMDYENLGNSLDFFAANKVKELPKHIQEALLYCYYEQNKTLKNVPKIISPGVVLAFEKKNIEDTFWKYIIFVSKQKEKK